MKLISHRGNISGKQPKCENAPYYIDDALELGFDVEIDVWWHNKNFYLGHDEPMYKVEKKYLQNYKLWCHAKNINALYEMRKNNIHCFWHEDDCFTLTSKGYIWTYPEKKVTNISIIVLNEKNDKIPEKTFGICSDFVELYRKNLLY